MCKTKEYPQEDMFYLLRGGFCETVTLCGQTLLMVVLLVKNLPASAGDLRDTG